MTNQKSNGRTSMDDRTCNFQLRAAELVRNAVHADHAFCLIGRDGIERRARGWSVGTHGCSRIDCSTPLLEPLGLTPLSAADTVRRTYITDQTWLGRIPELTSQPAARAVVLLADDATCFGLAGVSRLTPFEPEELRTLDKLVPAIAAGAATQLAADDLACQLAVMRALGPGLGRELIVNLEQRAIVWASEPGRMSSPCSPFEEHALTHSIEQRLLAAGSDEVLPTPIRLPMGLVVAAAELGPSSPFAERCAAARVQSFENCFNPLRGLSSRERAVARFLVNG